MPGHGSECRTTAALADRRAQLTERRRGQTLVTPETRSRWNRTYKLKLMGLTPERFSQMLEAQGNACEMCRTAFEEDHLICIDHDHACCPPALPSRCCGQCVRGPAVPQLQYRPRVHRGVLRTGDGQPQTALRRPVPPNRPGIVGLRCYVARKLTSLSISSRSRIRSAGVLPRPGTARHGEPDDVVPCGSEDGLGRHLGAQYPGVGPGGPKLRIRDRVLREAVAL